MANPGFGQRRAVDVLAELSFHVVEPIVMTTMTVTPVKAGFGDGGFGYNGSAADGGGFGYGVGYVFTVGDLDGIYVGAWLVLGYQASTEEAVQVVYVNYTLGYFIANSVNIHAAGETIFSATFPTQQPTDPLWTQGEVLTYLARAQNDFLNKVPLIFDLFGSQPLSTGQQFQTLPPTAIELERVAVQSTEQQQAISTISRAADIVTAVLQLPSNFTPGLAILVSGVTDTTFNSVANATFTLTTVSSDGLTLTWAQTAANASSTGGVAGPPTLTRLYESSQEQIAMRDPAWFVNTASQTPTNWYEDRSGIYGWGTAPIPVSNFYAELLCSVRDTTELKLLDGFLIPDIFIFGVKYAALAAMWSKEGEQRSPTLAKFAQAKFDYVCMLADRFLRNVILDTGQAGGRG